MLFNSWQFLLFFPLVTGLYFALPHRFRWLLLLVASCIFYMAFIPAYLLILLFTIGVDYMAGLWIAEAEGQRRKLFLWMSILSNVAILGFFKYFNFLNDNVRALAHFAGWNYPIEALQIILPIGLSFHVFQSLSYVIEVYRGKQPPERHLGLYALYVMFYPQLVAGPIERPQNLLHQFRQEHRFDYERVTDGLKLMLWGLFMKVVIADRLAMVVNPIYSHPQDYTGLPLIAATVAFAFQIFCDFAGYSTIAIGAAKVMGFTLMQNFDRPYLSRSIREFWTRWHISLSTWFKDYLYIPLGGNRVPQWRWSLNLFVVFLVSGLWHGASWNFVIWGGLHGAFLVTAIWTASLRTRLAAAIGLDRWPRLTAFLQVTGTFSLVCFAWIFFRAKTLPDAWYIVSHLTVDLGPQLMGLKPVALAATISPGVQVLSLFWIMVLVAVQVVGTKDRLVKRMTQVPTWMRWAVYQAAIVTIILFGCYDNQAFIYFQF